MQKMENDGRSVDYGAASTAIPRRPPKRKTPADPAIWPGMAIARAYCQGGGHILCPRPGYAKV
jgi:hypothetical protein